MVLYLSNADLAPLIDMGECVAALEAAFAQWSDAHNLARRRMPVAKTALNVLAGALPGGDIFGLRTTVYGMDANTLTLYSATAGTAIAIMACGPISTTRTGAASGVATKHLARPDAKIVGIVGAGKTAREQLAAIAVARPLKTIRVYSRDKDKRAAFAADVSKRLNVEAVPADSAEAALAGADIVVTATNSPEPVVKGAWLQPGQHINAIGANALDRREVDNAGYLKADLICIDHKEQGPVEAGALSGLVGAGKLSWDRIAELGEIVEGTKPGRTGAQQITLFNSLGIGFEDVAYGYHVYRKAKAAGIGREVELP
jgi:ornithine cyclodeaminase/alanine dehydrogenase-like protein (mu-crystallin family)